MRAPAAPAAPTPGGGSAAMGVSRHHLQDTIAEFKHVLNVERAQIRKSILELEQRLQELDTECALREDELMLWEERLVQIKEDNDVKFRLAKARADGARVRRAGGASGGSGGSGSGRREGLGALGGLGGRCSGSTPATALDGIAEGNEESSEGSPSASRLQDFQSEGPQLSDEQEAEFEEERDHVLELARKAASELEELRGSWTELLASLAKSGGSAASSATSRPAAMAAAPVAAATGGVEIKVAGAPSTPSLPMTPPLVASRSLAEEARAPDNAARMPRQVGSQPVPVSPEQPSSLRVLPGGLAQAQKQGMTTGGRIAPATPQQMLQGTTGNQRVHGFTGASRLHSSTPSLTQKQHQPQQLQQQQQQMHQQQQQQHHHHPHNHYQQPQQQQQQQLQAASNMVPGSGTSVVAEPISLKPHAPMLQPQRQAQNMIITPVQGQVPHTLQTHQRPRATSPTLMSQAGVGQVKTVGAPLARIPVAHAKGASHQ